MMTVEKIKNGGFNILKSSVPLVMVLVLIGGFTTYIWSDQRDSIKHLTQNTVDLKESKADRKELKELIDKKADRETVTLQYTQICESISDLKQQVNDNAKERNTEIRRLSDKIDTLIRDFKRWQQ